MVVADLGAGGMAERVELLAEAGSIAVAWATRYALLLAASALATGMGVGAVAYGRREIAAGDGDGMGG